MNRYVSRLGKVLVLAVASLLLVGNVFAQSVPAVGAKAYIPNTQKLEAAFYLQNPASQGGLGGFNFNSFEYHVGGVNFTAQILAALGGRGSQLYFSPNGTTMVGYVAGAFTGIPFANAPVMAKACLLTGPCFSSDRRIRNATGFPTNPGAINQQSPFLPAYATTSSSPTYGISFVPLAPTYHMVLSRLAAVINSDINPMTQNGPEWNDPISLNIWSGSSFTAAKAAFDQSPLQGNYVADMPLTQVHQPYAGHWYVDYTLQNHVPLMAGTHYVIAVEHAYVSAGHRVAFKESNLVQQTDYYKADTFPVSQPLTSFNLNPGAVTLDFYAYP